MKAILIAFYCLVAVAAGAVITRFGDDFGPRNLGQHRCTWGPSYWCQSLENSKECNITHHCVKKVWENMHVPEDNDDICTICKDMVTKARNQLESNETQDELKQVFEGSCKLMIIPVVIQECKRLADDFVPELIETLASQMDPSVVCTVSGLCNSRKIDKLLYQYPKKNTEWEKKKEKPNQRKIISLKNDEVEPDKCSQCFANVTSAKKLLDQQTRENIYSHLSYFCGNLGSYSDSCLHIINKYFTNIYDLKSKFTPKNICHLTGDCSGKYHKHEDDVDIILDVEINPMSSQGILVHDLPCKFCEQLVGHLKELLVANSTEEEFKLVMDGICTQTGKFASECKALVDEYYLQAYNFLVDEFDQNKMCKMAGLCLAPGQELEVPFMPLLPSESIEKVTKLMNKIFSENEEKTSFSLSEADEMQLPIERTLSLLNFPSMDVEGQKTCKLCEDVIHYFQEFITESTTMSEIQDEMDKVCAKLPAVSGTCEEFVNNFGPALIAILAGKMDPTKVCPFLNICPSKEMIMIWENIPKDYMLEVKMKEEVTMNKEEEEVEKEVKMNKEEEVEKDKASCPLCIFAVEQLYQTIKDDKTEEKIREELDKLCSHFSDKMEEKCVEFVKSYTDELIEKFLKNVDPKEICQMIKLCDDTLTFVPSLYPTDAQGEIISNEIPEYPIEKLKTSLADIECEACQALMKYLEKKLQDKQTEDEIKKIVHGACPYVFGYEKECNKFVDQYADLIIDMLANEVEPVEICTAIKVCVTHRQRFEDSLDECDLCQTVASTVDSKLSDPNVNSEIETVVEDICNFVPQKMNSKCQSMMDSYKASFINSIQKNNNTKNVCKAIAFCSPTDLYVMYKKSYRRYFNK